MRAALTVALIALGLCGCASESLQLRTLPPQTPAADLAAAAENEAALAAAVAEEATGSGAAAAQDPPPPVTPADAPSMVSYDPWERLNRFTYRFNARFDEAVFLPVANTYRRLPSPLRSGVHNFFANLAEVNNVINYTLQWRLRLGVRSLGRFVVNSTLGLGGLIDVGKHIRLPDAPTGFSTTLGRWGMHPGPYLVLPLLGPSTLRDGFGLVADFGTDHVVNLANFYRGNESWFLGGTNIIDERANVDFRYYSTGSPFEYDMIRFLVVHKRLLEDEGLHRRSPDRRPDPAVPAGE
jgi:phospholipid-binding lipoprotein MlaA